MKAFAVSLLCLIAPALYSNALADELAERLAAVPNPRIANGWVADPANVIAARHTDINRLLTDLEQRTSVEVAVVVLPTIGQLVPKDFAVALFQHWGIGKAGKDNGLLVLHILDQRRIEIETGYGLEGVLPDVKCFWITEEVAVPFFKQSSFADGHNEVVRALIRGIDQPDIQHAALVSQLSTQPGATVDAAPDIPEYDAIALQYAPTGTRLLHSHWTPIALLLFGGLFYFATTLVYRVRSSGKSPYAKYQLFDGVATKLQYASALPVAASTSVFEYAQTDTFISSVPALLAVLFATNRQRSKTLKALRDAPRICECGKPMHRLSELEDNAHIQPGNVAEESIDSMDYDVWTCDCGRSSIESYKGKSPADSCPKCNYRTYRVTNTRTLQAATTSSSGLREITHTCAYCKHNVTKTETIPKISTSSSSSGSRSSSGSFGGGRSGGGGAGSSY